MTDCSRFEDDLKAYTDGELSWLRRRAVRRHLTHCASCREEMFQMTQIAEDLRSADPNEALSPTLREKILENGPSAHPNKTPIQGSQKKSEQALPNPAPQNWGFIGVGGGAYSRRRPILAWGLAGVVLVGWFAIFPVFQKVRENARRISPTASYAPAASAKMQVRLSDREAGMDKNGKVFVQIKNPNSQYQINAMSGVQSFDLNNPPAGFTPLRQVHKEASVGIQVANPEATGDTVAAMVKETGGFVAANNLTTGDDGLKSGELIVKVPVTQFETFLAQVAKIGNVQSKNISGEDITEKTSDANQTEGVLEDDVQQSEARLKSLGAKAKWRDEEAIRDLRIQLAQARARLVLLKRMAALGQITVDLSQTPKAVTPPPVTGGFLNTLKGNTHDALQSLVGSAAALLALVIWLLAYAPIWIPLLLIGRYGLKEYQKREAQA